MPAYLNSKYEEQIEFQDENGDTLDVSTYAFGMLWYAANSKTLKVTLTAGSGIDVTNAATGIIIISLTPAQVTTIGPGMARVLLYKDYADDAERTLIAEGSESIESQGFDA